MLFYSVLTYLMSFAYAQDTLQLFDASAFPTLSAACASALALPLACSEDIADGDALYKYNGMTSAQLTSLCTDRCSTSVVEYRKKVSAACANDVFEDGPTQNSTLIVPGTNTDYSVFDAESVRIKPIAFVDVYILNYNLNCLKDSDGTFCYIKANGSQLPQCSKCTFDSIALELEDAQHYNVDLASSAMSSASLCGSKLSFTTPSAVYVASPTTATGLNSTTCSGSMVAVKTGDTCDKFASSHNISTSHLLQVNGLIANCVDFPSTGALCIDGACKTYILGGNDTCPSVASSHNITIVQLLSWNPDIDPRCINLATKIGHSICVSSPLGFDDTGALNTTRPLIATEPAQVPTNIAPNTTRNCGSYYVVQTGEFCNTVVVKTGISILDFYFLNPGVNSTCGNLWADTSYCVQAVGDISTYAGYDGALPTTTYPPVTDYIAPWTDLPTATRLTFAPISTSSSYPLAEGTRLDCFEYFQNSNSNSDCQNTADNFGARSEDFLIWNPSLLKDMGNSTKCVLRAQTSYCVDLMDSSLLDQTASVIEYPDVPYDAAVNSTTQCSGWWEVQSGDTCEIIMKSVDISYAALYSWNPSLGELIVWATTYYRTDNCQHLWANTSYCIFGPGREKDCYSCSGTATVVSSTTSGGPSRPTQSGIVVGCKGWYTTVAGDDCSIISAKYSITFAQFLSWNPAVKSDCSGLWLDESYCIAGPSSTTTSKSISPTSTAASAPSPTQTGIVRTCNKFTQQQGGVYCADMATAAGITLAKLYEWNPALKGDCSGLWPGYYYCVGVSS